MKKEWLMIIFSVSLTLIIALGLVRWFAPQLLGLPVDLQMVRVAEKVPPFFEGVFRSEDYENQKYIIRDPYIKRAMPLFPRFIGMGPNDILGFRNKYVPNTADIITIGDSQTYGNNAFLEQNWPSSMVRSIKQASPVLYNMSVGAWGAAEYFEILNKALYLQPKMIIVAFYTGNDPIDTFNKVYDDDRWESLRLNPKLKSSDAPTLKDFVEWKVKFHDEEIIFTPDYRYLSNNRNDPVVLAGYAIMGKIATKMGEIAASKRIKLVFTIIPTKELAFKQKILLEKIKPREDYANLVNDEEKNLRGLAEILQKVPGAIYIDLLPILQQGVVELESLYPSNKDGHPLANGYELIGSILYKDVAGLLPQKLNGVYFVQNAIMDQQHRPNLIKDNYFYIITSRRILLENGWSEEKIPKIDKRDINMLSFGGFIDTVDPVRFGPGAFKR